MQVFSILADIETDLGNMFGIAAKTGHIFTNSKPYREIISPMLDEYRKRLKTATPAELQRTAKLRAQELAYHYQQGKQWLGKASNRETQDRKRIAALCDLSIGFIAASVVEYSSRRIKGFIEAFTPSLQQEDLERLAASAESQGITDAATFREQYIKAPALAPSPKEAILHNAQALALLKKMQDAGMLDARYQWNKGYTIYAQATFANYISMKADIQNWDAAFTNLWGKKHGTFSKAVDALKYKTTRTKYQNMLSVFD